ncbi:MAG: hypothetical protein BMS9Abin10_0273 [Gammaproteobacteria bacterium]|nr:MAG: hypothetical protein BMS9Abin10_0273 [Gammaproteobacteria bacterium]
MAWLTDNWVWVLLGVGMVAMHLFGHKGHGGRGQDKAQGGDSAGAQQAHAPDTGAPAGRAARHVDPVCRREVDTDQGYGMMYESRLLRFCSRECLDRFEAEPATYLAQQQTGS